MRDPLVRLVLALRTALRRFLGVEQDVDELRTLLGASTELTAKLVAQLNRTTTGAADLSDRLRYYEEHVEAIRFHAGRLKSAKNVGVKPNGAGLIHLLGEPG